MEKSFASKLICGGLLAGCAIGVAATIYLKVGGVLGAAMFAFGLIVVVSMKLPLFTGQAQHVMNRVANDYAILGLMLGLNLVGCFIIAQLYDDPALTEAAEKIITARVEKGALMCGILSIPCGFIMTAAVRGAALDRNWLPLLFGVPAFIICGFPHCVADSYYYASCSPEFIKLHGFTLLGVYLPTVAGNFIGCNLYRLVKVMPGWFSHQRQPAKAEEQTIDRQPSLTPETGEEKQ